jgi:hypothetical protein
MRHKITMAIALAATLALTVAASASAALPEFVPRSGIFPYHFSGENGQQVQFESEKSTYKYACLGAKISGEITSSKEVKNVVEEFRNCNTSPLSCENNGAKGIKSVILHGTLGYVNKANKEVGLKLIGTEKTGEEPLYAELNCGFSGKEYLRGKLIAKVTPLNTELEEFDLKYEQLFGFQNPSAFEGEASGQQLHVSTIPSELGLRLGVWSPQEGVKAPLNEGPLRING